MNDTTGSPALPKQDELNRRNEQLRHLVSRLIDIEAPNTAVTHLQYADRRALYNLIGLLVVDERGFIDENQPLALTEAQKRMDVAFEAEDWDGALVIIRDLAPGSHSVCLMALQDRIRVVFVGLLQDGKFEEAEKLLVYFSEKQREDGRQEIIKTRFAHFCREGDWEAASKLIATAPEELRRELSKLLTADRKRWDDKVDRRTKKLSYEVTLEDSTVIIHMQGMRGSSFTGLLYRGEGIVRKVEFDAKGKLVLENLEHGDYTIGVEARLKGDPERMVAKGSVSFSVWPPLTLSAERNGPARLRGHLPYAVVTGPSAKVSVQATTLSKPKTVNLNKEGKGSTSVPMLKVPGTVVVTITAKRGEEEVQWTDTVVVEPKAKPSSAAPTDDDANAALETKIHVTPQQEAGVSGKTLGFHVSVDDDVSDVAITVLTPEDKRLPVDLEKGDISFSAPTIQNDTTIYVVFTVTQGNRVPFRITVPVIVLAKEFDREEAPVA